MSLLASQSQGKGGPDKIFYIGGLADARAAEVGRDKIVNATIGAFLDGEGKLITMKTVEESLRNLPFYDSANYAPIAGLPKFIEAAIDAAFQDCRPEGYIRGVATPGGTGSIHHAVQNYLEEGDTCISADRYWAAYQTICAETGRKLDTFQTFTSENEFNLQGCLSKVHSYAKTQKNVMLLLNTPANNPTGYSLHISEWQYLIKELTDLANQGKNNVILLVDIAYIDYAGPGSREFFKLFGNLPKNFLVIVAFSMSKGYTMYGYRSGCMICVTSDEGEANAFVDANQYSSRATWSNCNRAAQLTLIDIYEHPEKKAAFLKEQEALRLSLLRRAEIFIKEANEIALKICPFDSGFFITVPTEKAEDIAAELRNKDIFLVPLGKGANAGLRVAICAIPEEKIFGMAKKIKEAMDIVDLLK